jgi:hypothetical protein
MNLTDQQIRMVLKMILLARELVRDLEAKDQPPEAVEHQLLDALDELEKMGFPTGLGGG